jgi:hypothetical protein
VKIPDHLTEGEILRFGYLRAVYSLNTFHGYRIRPYEGFEADNERICAEVIGRGGNIVDMFESGADPVYCALLSDPVTDKCLLLKTVERYIPF